MIKKCILLINYSNQPIKTYNPMKKNWVTVLLSSIKNESLIIKKLLEEKRVKLFLHELTGSIQQATLYVPNQKVGKTLYLVRTANLQHLSTLQKEQH